MRNDAAASILAAAALSGLGVLMDALPVQAQTTPPLRGIASDAFAHPKVSAPSGSTTFTPASADNLFTAQMLAKVSNPAQKQTMRLYAGQVNQMVETAYTNFGYPKNDVGVALGGFLETCWEMTNGTFKTETGDEQDKAKTRTTVRQMQNALLALPAYKTMSPQSKQLLYEACTFMMGHLATQWQQAGSDSAKKDAVRQSARQQLHTLFGVGADTLTRRPDGTFASTSAPASGTGKAAASVATAKTTLPPTAKASSGPLPAAQAHGARIFVKYSFTGTTTSIDQLILFPSGAAFTDVPRKPISQFDEASLRAGLKPYDVGTWKEAGNTLVLTFPAKKRDTTTTLRKVAKGWYDGEGMPKADNAYDTYYPVLPLTPAQISGAWKTQSLTTMGFAGGAAPFVAGGSSGARVFHADGTFTGGKKSFASATTANMGDAFKSGGDVGAYSNKEKSEAGRWRLDGPLITLESNGQRLVTTAFGLPNWSKTGPPDILIDGDWWKRPDKD